MSRRRGRRNPPRSRVTQYAVGGLVIAAIAVYLAASGTLQSHATTTATQQRSVVTTTGSATKPVILYVNQGNGAVNSSNFAQLLTTAASHSFNTIFFQVYRSGVSLFTDAELQLFANDAHGSDMKIYFALYFTNATQAIPTSVYGDGEDGINLDMSTLPPSTQSSLLASLTSSYTGKTAVTATDFASTLKPDMLILETYGSGDDQYIHPGTVASVGVFTATSSQQYGQEFQYALNNSDGVMVFDYAGLIKAGY